MKVKDDALNKKYIEQNREVVYQRAKFNIAYVFGLLLISPLYLLVDFPTFFAVTLVWAATFLSLAIVTFISKFRRFGTEFVLTANIIARGLVMNFIMRH